MNRIIIIDGNSLINRAYYAMQRPMITKEGVYTQGIYGFLNMLNKILDDYSPEYITVAFDKKSPTFRHVEYEAYKAGRKKMPPELAMQMPILKDVLHALNIETLEIDGFEADDIIGTIARDAEERDIEPLIITGDKDALQLATDKTKILITKKGISDFDLYDREKMIERYELTPEQFIDLKGLMGDQSDNIPGLPGVGEKTGIKLLEQFGSIENMLSHTEEIKNEKLRIKVEENAQLAVMSKRLATINTNVPLEYEFDRFLKEEPDYNKLIDLYSKLEFNSFLKKLNIKDSPQITSQTFEEEKTKERAVISTLSEMETLNKIQDKSEIILKVFSDNNHVALPLITGVSLMSESNYFYIKCEDGQILEKLIDTLNKKEFSYFGHDLVDDYYALMSYGFININTCFDTAVASYVIDPTKSNYNIKILSLENLHYEIKDEKEFLAENGQINLFNDNSQVYADYGFEICQAISRLRILQTNEIESNGLKDVFVNAELPLIEVLSSMEVNGFAIDKETLTSFGIELKNEITSLEKGIYELAGSEFNINSPVQLGVVLFENLELPAGKKTKRGYSTNAEVLEKLKDKHPIVNKVLEYRTLSKLNSTYVEGLIPLICKDQKIRAHFQQTVTATGRISCTEPNLQNIPIRTELGRQLRKAFIPSQADNTLVGADYSQIELRVLAHLSEDKDLIEAFNHGADIHKLTAAKVLGIPFDQVTSEERSKAKAVNFGVIYGMSGFGLSENLNITRKEAEKYIADYFAKYGAVKNYMDGQIESCKEKGYSQTIMGRKRPIHEINSSNYMVRQLGERLAMNSPIQGSAADIIKLAMINVYGKLKEGGFKSKLILQVHDELIIDAVPEELSKIKELLVDTMEGVMRLKVKLESQMNYGKTWYDLK